MDIAEAHLKVLEHFSKPGAELAKGAFNPLAPGHETNRCYYRSNGQGDDPRRCGIGSLIPDELYDSRWEHTVETYFGSPPIGLLMHNQPVVAELFKDIPIEYLSRLQGMHDASENVEDFLSLLGELQEQWRIQLAPDFPPTEEVVREQHELVTV